MKSKNSKKKNLQTRESAAYLAARAAEAEKQAEAARRLARLAKSRFKDARKAFKQAKKFAKQARKQAKTAAKALKQQVKRTRKPPTKKTLKAAQGKSGPTRNASVPRSQPRRPKTATAVTQAVRQAPPTTEIRPDIAQP